jgi:hypothetical protein
MWRIQIYSAIVLFVWYKYLDGKRNISVVIATSYGVDCVKNVHGSQFMDHSVARSESFPRLFNRPLK